MERLNASVDCATNRTIDPANAAAHSWRANLFNVSKYRKVQDPNTDNFSALLNLKTSNGRNKLKF